MEEVEGFDGEAVALVLCEERGGGAEVVECGYSGGVSGREG